MTPVDIVERSVRVLGGEIDLDPASSDYANIRVGARCFLTKEVDALSVDWFDYSHDGWGMSIFCNPPGGKLGNKSMTGLFWGKLMELRDSGKLEHAVFLAFSLEAMQSTQHYGSKAISDFPVCVPSRRIKFVAPPPSLIKTQPSHSNAIVYVPGSVDATEGFVSEFGCIGKISVPYLKGESK